MTKESKDYGKSVKAKLLNLSKAEGVPYQPLLIRYVQERLLYRLAQSKYKNWFYLKGGVLLYAHEQLNARPTLDIDFLGNSINNDKKIIEEAFSEICSISYKEDGTKFWNGGQSYKRKVISLLGEIQETIKLWPLESMWVLIQNKNGR